MISPVMTMLAVWYGVASCHALVPGAGFPCSSIPGTCCLAHDKRTSLQSVCFGVEGDNISLSLLLYPRYPGCTVTVRVRRFFFSGGGTQHQPLMELCYSTP